MTDSIFIVTDGNKWRSPLIHDTRADAEQARDHVGTVVEYIPAGWRSMETAPKDRCILVRVAGAPTVAEWDEPAGMWCDGCYEHYTTGQLGGWFPIPEDK